MRRTLAWLGVFVVAASALIFAAVDEGIPETNADRAYALANDFACPVCQGQSVAESDAPTARNIRREIQVWVDEGRSDQYIRDQLVLIWGEDIHYTPAGSGITSLVWILPVVGGVAAAAGLTVAVRRWQVAGSETVRDETSPDSEPSRRTSSPGERSRGRIAVWTGGIAVLALVAGILVAQFSGTRRAGESVSGDIRTTTREMLFEAGVLSGEGDVEGAIEIYDEVLELQPTNTEALSYKAWMLRLTGEIEAAAELIDEALVIDPEYADARVFAAAIAMDLDDVDAAVAHLEVFDQLDAPPAMDQLVGALGLRSQIELAQYAEIRDLVAATLSAEDPPTFAESGFTVDDLLGTAELMAFDGQVLEAIQLVGQVVAEVDDDPDLLAGYAWLLARSATPDQPETAELARDRLDEALAIDPAHPESLVYRAFVHALLGNLAAGAADLAAFDALTEPPADLLDLIAAFDLRAQLS